MFDGANLNLIIIKTIDVWLAWKPSFSDQFKKIIKRY